MFEELKQGIMKEISGSVGQVINQAANQVRRKITWFILRTLALVLAILFCALGIILLGAKYVGSDLMLLTVGILFLILFFVSK